jgi:hypothetical protein
MNIKIYYHAAEIEELQNIHSFSHKGIGFFDAQSGIIHAFTSYPKVLPMGKPFLMYFEKPATPPDSEALLSRLNEIEQEVMSASNMTEIEILGCAFLKKRDERKAIIKWQGETYEADIEIIPNGAQLNNFSGKKVVLVGANQITVEIAKLLASLGVNNFTLVDIQNDNFSTNPATYGHSYLYISQQIILSQNSNSSVNICKIDASENDELLDRECQDANLLISVIDEDLINLAVNEIAVKLNKNAIFCKVISDNEGIEVFNYQANNANTPCLACAIGTGRLFKSDYRQNKSLKYEDFSALLSYLVLLSSDKLQNQNKYNIKNYSYWSAKEDSQPLHYILSLWEQIYPADNSPKALRWLSFSFAKSALCPVCQ